MRTPVIVGNWKMNMTPSEAKSLLEELVKLDLDESVEKGVCVPAIDLLLASEILKDSDIKFGAENMHYEDWRNFSKNVK